MKKAKKAKTKTKTAPVRASAMRDLELLDPAAKQIKGESPGARSSPSRRGRPPAAPLVAGGARRLDPSVRLTVMVEPEWDLA